MSEYEKVHKYAKTHNPKTCERCNPRESCHYCTQPATVSLHQYATRDGGPWVYWTCDEHMRDFPDGPYDYFKSLAPIEPLVTFS